MNVISVISTPYYSNSLYLADPKKYVDQCNQSRNTCKAGGKILRLALGEGIFTFPSLDSFYRIMKHNMRLCDNVKPVAAQCAAFR